MVNKPKTTKTKKPKQRVFAFIDNQNLNLGVQKMGWKMNWKALREFLTNEYGVTEAYMFIGYMKEHEELYTQMYDTGYNVVLKPTVGMFVDKDDQDKDKPPAKGNVDVDLVLEAMKQWNRYDKAIIISGDGDFYALIEHMEQKNKLLHIMAPNWMFSSLLKPYEKYVVRIDKLKKELEYRDYKKSPRKGKVKK